MSNEFVSDVLAKAKAIRQMACRHPIVGHFVDVTRPIPRPFLGTGDIRLVIVGQDPTVQRTESRAKITTVLNLDRRGSLHTYLVNLCRDLDLDIDQHVYATNACKCFFTDPPTTILKRDGVDVLVESADLWLPLLVDELAHFPDAFIMSLGEPVLAMLARPEHRHPMREYWGYHRRWPEGMYVSMHAIDAEESTVGRRIFPIVHEPTQRGRRTAFYRERRQAYIAFIREANNL